METKVPRLGLRQGEIILASVAVLDSTDGLPAGTVVRDLDLIAGCVRSRTPIDHQSAVLALVGNLFGPIFGNQPNLNTVRGDKPRSALRFIAS